MTNKKHIPITHQCNLKRNAIVCPKCAELTTFCIPNDAIDEDGEFYRCQHCGWVFHYRNYLYR